MEKANTNKTPIYRESGFCLDTTKKTLEAFKAEVDNPHEPENYIYSRYRNPTVVAVEQVIAKIEDSKWALVTQSGMAAIDTALSIFQEVDSNSPWLFFTEIYGGTNTYIDLILKRRRGVDIQYFAPAEDSYDINAFTKMLDKVKPKLIYLEIVSNPMLIVADAKKIINEAKKRGIIVIVDNTFITPYLYKPLMHGADLVIHSATKYLSGHGNITAGVICGNDIQMMQSAIEYRKWVGHMISPDDAYRLNTQLKTFELRYEKQIKSAYRLAQFLENQPMIEKVIYPGLVSHSTHEIAKELFQNKGYGGIITFQLAGNTDENKRTNSEIFIEEISKYFDLIPTLGDTETIFMPIDAVWGDKYPYPGTLRLSIGIEDYPHIESVIAKALKKCKF